MPGPPPTPTEVLKVRGSRLLEKRKAEPKSTNKIPDCPGVLQGEAKRTWGRVTKCLQRMKIVDQIDRELISSYCLAWAAFHRIVLRQRELEEEQEVCKDAERAGQIDKALWRLEVSWAKAFDKFIKAADRLGVGPAARARVKVSEEPEASPFEAFIAGKTG